VRSRGYWRGVMTLDDHPEVPLLIVGGRGAPDEAGLAVARELPGRYPALRGAIAVALFEHYEPYRDSGETNDDSPHLANPDEVWPHTNPVQVIVAPVDGRPGAEIGYATAWDIEHTLGAVIVDWQLVELNGSVRRLAATSPESMLLCRTGVSRAPITRMS